MVRSMYPKIYKLLNALFFTLVIASCTQENERDRSPVGSMEMDELARELTFRGASNTRTLSSTNIHDAVIQCPSMEGLEEEFTKKYLKMIFELFPKSITLEKYSPSSACSLYTHVFSYIPYEVANLLERIREYELSSYLYHSEDYTVDNYLGLVRNYYNWLLQQVIYRPYEESYRGLARHCSDIYREPFGIARLYNLLWIRDHSFYNAIQSHEQGEYYDLEESYEAFRRHVILNTSVSDIYNVQRRVVESFSIDQACGPQFDKEYFIKLHRNIMLSISGKYIPVMELLKNSSEKISYIASRDIESYYHYQKVYYQNLTGDHLLFGFYTDTEGCWYSDTSTNCQSSLRKAYKILYNDILNKAVDLNCAPLSPRNATILVIEARELAFELADQGVFTLERYFERLREKIKGNFCFARTSELLLIEDGVRYCDTGPIHPSQNSCINSTLPPRPFRIRGFVNDIIETPYGTNPEDYDSLNIYPFTAEFATSAHPPEAHLEKQQVTLPIERSTNDGRILLHSNFPRRFRVFRPESIDQNSQTREGATVDEAHLSRYTKWLNPLWTTNSNGQVYADYLASLDDESSTIFWQKWQTHHGTICDPGGFGQDGSNPYRCQVNNKIGDCYDITLIQNWFSREINQWEMHSVDLTLMVFNPKSRQATVEIYPRSAKGNLINYISTFLRIVILDPEKKDLESEYQKGTKFRTSFNYTRLENGHLREGDWDGKTDEYNHQLFEPIVSSDGRVLVLNTMHLTGLAYTITDTPCDIDGWDHLQPITSIPWDQRAKNLGYGMALSNWQQGFRQSDNSVFRRGEVIRGVYPWIDRNFSNIVFSTDSAKEKKYKLDPISPKYDESMTNYSQYQRDHNIFTKGAKRMSFVLGAWTQGKAIHLDNGLSQFDFGATEGQWRRELLAANLQLYGDKKLGIRPAGARLFGSFENVFNFISGMIPRLPFDVVWRVSSDVGRVSEIAFDEYMMNNALVIQHMNEMVLFNKGQLNYSTQQYNGFKQYSGQDHIHIMSYSQGWPKLQNAATSASRFRPGERVVRPPVYGKLVGGARIEPVAQGGIIGKGVYLDGVNDYIAQGEIPPQEEISSYYFGVWLDASEMDDRKNHLILGTSLGVNFTLSRERFSVFFPEEKNPELSIEVQGLPKKGYFHLGFVVHPFQFSRFNFLSDATTELSVFLNGTFIGRRSFTHSRHERPLVLVRDNQWDWFSIGGRSLLANQITDSIVPWRGWIDEVRVYAHTDYFNLQEMRSERDSHFYLREFFCNLAYGTLVEFNQSFQETDRSEAGKSNINRLGRQLGLNLNDRNTPFICEQINLADISEESFYDIPYSPNSLCIGKIHHKGTKDPACARSRLLNISQLKADKPRPDESKNNFCLTCHINDHPLSTMEVDAPLIEHQGLIRRDDPRRQPMEWPRLTTGNLPRDFSYRKYMDEFFDFNPPLN